MTRRDHYEQLRVVTRRNARRDLAALRHTKRGTRRWDRKLEQVAGAARLLIALDDLLDLDDLELAALTDPDGWVTRVAVEVDPGDAMDEVARLRGWNGLVATSATGGKDGP